MQRATKIVATLGPASSTQDVLNRMLAAGVDVVRCAMLHGRSAARSPSWLICRARRYASESSRTAR